MRTQKYLPLKVIIPHNELGKNMDNLLESKVQQDFLNKVIPNIGIIENIDEIILTDRTGEIVNKGIKYNLEIGCNIFYLEVGEIIKAKIQNTTNIGIFAICENILANIFVPKDETQLIKGQFIDVKLDAVRINDVEITAIGSIVE